MDNRLSTKSFAEFRSSESGYVDEDLVSANILVVDDSRTARALITRHLRAGGYNNIDCAGDGHEALKAVNGRMPELIISDLLMPNLDGFELCRVLRTDPRTEKIPVLAQTASTDPNIRAKAFEAGATDLVPKPLDPRELLLRVRILLERGRLVERLSEFRRLIATELQQAASIQDSLLPSDAMLEEVLRTSPLSVSGHYEASAGLGGDLWGIETVGDQRILMFNADFVGHGLGAALNTVRLHSFLNGTQDKSTVPGVLLGEMNKFLCDVLPIGQFATMFCAVMDCRRRIIDYACAGSPPQLLKCAAGRTFELIQEPGFPLGVTRDANYITKSAPFAPGAMLILFSDALIETPFPPNSAFSPDTLRRLVNELPSDISAQGMRNRLLSELFARTQIKPDDDLTLIAAQFLTLEQQR